MLTRLSQGTLVKVNTYVSADGYEWYQCVSGNTTGYLRGDMIRLLNVREYQNLLTSGNNRPNGGTGNQATPRPSSVTVNTWATNNPGSPITFITIPPMNYVTAAPLPTATMTPEPTQTIAPATFQPAATITAPAFLSTGTASGLVTVPPTAFAPVTDAPTPNREFEKEDDGGFNVGGLVIALVVLLLLAAAGLYGYSVYNKARRQQAEERARKMAAAARQRSPQEGVRPAVRRTDVP